MGGSAIKPLTDRHVRQLDDPTALSKYNTSQIAKVHHHEEAGIHQEAMAQFQRDVSDVTECLSKDAASQMYEEAVKKVLKRHEEAFAAQAPNLQSLPLESGASLKSLADATELIVTRTANTELRGEMLLGLHRLKESYELMRQSPGTSRGD